MEAWEQFLKTQEQELGQKVVDQWLRSLQVVRFDAGNLYLQAKDPFQLAWFEEHIRHKLKSALFNNNSRPIKVHLAAPHAVEKTTKKQSPLPLKPITISSDTVYPLATFEQFLVGAKNQQTVQLFTQALDSFGTYTQMDSKVGNLAKPAPQIWDSEAATKQLNLNKLSDAGGLKDVDARSSQKPTFESICVYNPLYLYGDPGVGKTHLLMAAAHHLRKQGHVVFFTRAETFTEQLVNAIRNQSMKQFRDTYRQQQVVIIDGIDQMARRSATQEEFFHTFNALHSAGRQIIIAGSCPPQLLTDIEPRLSSRFSWGLILRLESLSNQELEQLFQQRCGKIGIELSEQVSQFLLSQFQHHPSTLFQALEQLVYRSKQKKMVPDLAKVTDWLRPLIEEEKRKAASPEKVVRLVSEIYGIRPEDILGKSQTQECVLPRQLAMYLCRLELKMAYAKIGRFFERDHSTVMSSVKQIETRTSSQDEPLCGHLSQITRKLKH
jgi:chromosomal replication initiator protein